MHANLWATMSLRFAPRERTPFEVSFGEGGVSLPGALVGALSMTELGHPVLLSMSMGQFPAARVTSDRLDSQVSHSLGHHPLGFLLREGCA